jgi:hypothetical protein
MQTKLHRWAEADLGRRFDDLRNLVYDPAFLVVAWDRVRGNKGARTAGIDGIAPRAVDHLAGALLEWLGAGVASRGRLLRCRRSPPSNATPCTGQRAHRRSIGSVA